MIILVLPFLLLNLFEKLKPMGQFVKSLLLIFPPLMTLILQGNNDIDFNFNLIFLKNYPS